MSTSPATNRDWLDGEHSPQSLRSVLAGLDRAGELLRIPEPVAAVHEISAMLEALRDGPPVLFERVTGFDLPVTANLLSGPDRMASLLGETRENLFDRLLAAASERVPVRRVDAAPCQAVVEDDPDLTRLPVPTFFEHETGPYLTAGVIAARHPETGRGNLSYARLKLLGGNRAFIGIAPNHHLSALAAAAAAHGERLPIAVTLGNHPAVMLAAAYYLALGDDELEVAGALLGDGIEVIETLSSGIPVPAHCEIVLEGTIDAANRIEEGAVSEFHGLYERYKSGPVVTFQRLTRRRDAILQAIQPGFHPEHVWIGGAAISATLTRAVRASVPSARDVLVTEGGCGRMHAVVSLHDPWPGDARKAMFAVWASVNLIKHVTVVEDDVDIHDPRQVEWAVATRMKADRDLVVVPGVRADRADPLEQGFLIPKLGIDATRHCGDREDTTRAAPPEAVASAARVKVEAALESFRGRGS